MEFIEKVNVGMLMHAEKAQKYLVSVRCGEWKTRHNLTKTCS